MNWTLLRHICGMLLLLEALFLGVSTLVALYYSYTEGDGDVLSLAIPTVACAVLGFSLYRSSRHYSQSFGEREGYLIVSLMWVLYSLIGMLPYLIYGTCSTVTDAFLETMSGFTTTGCTVLTDIDAQPHGILLWRSLTQWIGGLGIVVFSLALLPKLGSGNIQMFSAEVTGMTVDKLRPKIQATSRRLWYIYVLLTLCCALLYAVGGMSVFDAVCHALTTLSSGGFSTHQSSLGWFQSGFIEYVCILFLFLASLNFNLYYWLSRGSVRQFWCSEEFRWFLYVVAGGTVLFVALHYAELLRLQLFPSDDSLFSAARLASMPDTFGHTVRASLFHVLTIISTCGFQGEWYDYQLWGHVFWLPTLFLMACGGCAGSTAGGFKMLRFVILIKNLRCVVMQYLLPKSHGVVMLDGHPLHNEYVRRTLAFVFLFFLVVMCGVFVLQLQGIDLDTALGTVISAVGNCGPGLGTTGPAFTWAELPALSKWVLSFTMLVGRLEIFTIILLFVPSFWRER